MTQAGDVLTYWHDDGVHRQLCYARVVKVNRVTIDVETENHGIKRVRPEVFSGRCAPEDWHPWKAAQ